jgi:hypothetical protein
MSLTNDVRNEIKEAKKLHMPFWAVVCVIIVSFLSAQLFDRSGKLSFVLPILNIVGVLGFVFVLKRQLWRHPWFWVTMSVIAFFHTPLILLAPWGTTWIPALAFAGIDSLDFCLILWILAFVGQVMRKQEENAER